MGGQALGRSMKSCRAVSSPLFEKKLFVSFSGGKTVLFLRKKVLIGRKKRLFFGERSALPCRQGLSLGWCAARVPAEALLVVSLSRPTKWSSIYLSFFCSNFSEVVPGSDRGYSLAAWA